jgi:methyl-accepting chemotaxis protein
MGLVGGVALWSIRQINTTVTRLTQDLAVELQQAEELGHKIILLQFYGSNFIQTREASYQNQYTVEAQQFQELLAQAGQAISDPARKNMLNQLQVEYQNYEKEYASLESISTTEDLLVNFMDLKGGSLQYKFDNLYNEAVKTEDKAYIADVAAFRNAFWQLRLDTSIYFQTQDTPHWEKVEQDYNRVIEILLRISPEILTKREEIQASTDPTKIIIIEGRDAEISSILTLVEEFYSYIEGLKESFAFQDRQIAKLLDELMPQVQQTAQGIATSVRVDYDRARQETGVVVGTMQIVLLGSILGVGALGCTLAVVISKGITRPLGQITHVSRQIAEVDLRALVEELNLLAEGDLTGKIHFTTEPVQIQSRDEIGQMAQAFNGIIAGLQEARRAYEAMTANLYRLISQVAENAHLVSVASIQLSAVAKQAGEATGQIGATMQGIARGTAQQTERVSTTSQSVEEMTHIIEGVAQGSQEQALSVSQAAEATTRMTAFIQKVAGHAQAGAGNSAEAAAIAREGAGTVAATIEDMKSIQNRVDLLAQKVQEMGSRSDQIGVILETIQDIASQTNLLALNAAIEAARAGEHGRGFAVVASEVRKLSESASQSAKEIGGLVKDIQQTVNQAIKATKEGTLVVQQGVGRADRSGQALDRIQIAVEAVNNGMAEIASATQEMNLSSDSLVSAMDRVSAVVEANTAATEQMSAGESEVRQAIEGIAGISEENAMAVEEISASAEEVNAQVEEVSASANTLAEMSQALRKLIEQFKLEKADRETPEERVSPRAPREKAPVA